MQLRSSLPTTEKLSPIYEKTRAHLDKLPIGFPKTESGIELKILQYFFSEEEAKLILCLELAPISPETILKRSKKLHSQLSDDQITETLDQMFMRGVVARRGRKAPYSYSLLMLAIGMFEFQVDHMQPEFVQYLHQYFDEGFGEEFFRASVPQLRTSPVMGAIVPEHRIAIYDDMKQYVEKTTRTIAVANCVCKQGEALLGKPCQVTDNIETCIMFGSSARDYIARNQAREITQNECLEILYRAEKKGLVFQPGNSLEPFCICCCCGDCCGVLTSAKKFDKPARLFATNFYAEFTEDLCKNCGICLKRCQMDALSRVDGKISLALDRCIGCGLCVSTCPTKALHLERKPREVVPPKHMLALYMEILKQKYGKTKLMLKMLKRTFGFSFP